MKMKSYLIASCLIFSTALLSTPCFAFYSSSCIATVASSSHTIQEYDCCGVNKILRWQFEHCEERPGAFATQCNAATPVYIPSSSTTVSKSTLPTQYPSATITYNGCTNS